MRGMICDNTVNGSIQNTRQNRLSILFCPKWRIHSIVCIPAKHGFLRHQEIMRTGFTSHLNTVRLCLANNLHTAAGAHMCK